MKKVCLCLIAAFMCFAASSQGLAKWKITDVEQYIARGNGDILVINFWATFCKPCVAEIPSFIKIVEAHKKDGVKLLLVSLDLPSYYPTKITTFAKKHQLNTHIVWLNETNADYFCPRIDSSWSGSIPATLIINTRTGFRKFLEEEMSQADFEAALKLALASTATGT